VIIPTARATKVNGGCGVVVSLGTVDAFSQGKCRNPQTRVRFLASALIFNSFSKTINRGDGSE